MRRLLRSRPSPRRLSAAVVLLGLVAALAMLLVPVEATFDDHPLLRLEPFSPGLLSAGTEVDCGRPVSNFVRRSEGLSLYGLASDDACRQAAGRRAATALAVAGVIGLLGVIGLGGAPNREVAAA